MKEKEGRKREKKGKRRTEAGVGGVGGGGGGGRMGERHKARGEREGEVSILTEWKYWTGTSTPSPPQRPTPR